VHDLTGNGARGAAKAREEVKEKKDRLFRKKERWVRIHMSIVISLY